ncbi:MAG: cysteine--tRNA ligase [Armatimonadetes bacterium]|nr:cysteine--tRNA ligase [Armatimonadota bacterium]MDW8026797.1 cysteine--tRNA ligase [Armatimonadota bacterium]
MNLRLYNTRTRKKEPLQTREPNVLHMYVCGLTPYDSMHIGHARAFMVYDVLHRYLEHRGWRVIHVQNWTDIDDKIIQRANELGLSAKEVSEKFIAEAEEDCRNLDLLQPTITPKVTEHIPDIIKAIQILIDKGYAYARGGDVYFDVSRYESEFHDYGLLSGQTRDELIAGARVAPDEDKDDPMDFALWKAAKLNEPFWDSPWGKGRPGWHIECSVMSLKYLGAPFDLHGGATDLVFPHHENEIAQSQALTGFKPIVTCWMHAGVLTVAGEKMSKSLGNFVTLREALKRHGKNALRLLYLSTHYRSPLDFSEERAEGAKASLRRIRTALEVIQNKLTSETSSETEESKGRASELTQLVEESTRLFYEAMDDDLNTAEAIGYLFRMVGAALTFGVTVKELPSRSEKLALNLLKRRLTKLLSVLGFDVAELEEPERLEDALGEQLLNLLIEVRSQLRQRKIFDLADMVRAKLNQLGIALEDTPNGTKWKRL